MQHLRSWAASPPSSPTKLRKSNSTPHIHTNSETRQFLDNLTISLSDGIQSVIDVYFGPKRETFVAANITIFNELRHHKSGMQTGSVSIPLANTTLRLNEKEDGIEIEMDGIKKLLPEQTFQDLINHLSDDALENTDHYGTAFSTYVENVANYEEGFPVYHNAYTKGLDKSQLYLSAKKEYLITSFNGEILIPGLNYHYVCRHFAAYLAYVILKNPLGKMDLSFYQNQERIVQTMPKDIEQIYIAFKAHAPHAWIIKNDNLGKHIKTRFEHMKEIGQVTVLLVETATHAMLIRLRMKGTDAMPIYVMNFYDPNITNTSVRYETSQLSTFETHTLQRYVDGLAMEEDGTYQQYIEGMEPIVLVTECCLNSLTQPSTHRLKRLNHDFRDQLSPTHMYLFLADNFYDNLIELKDQLRKIGEQAPERLVELLSAKNNEGIPGLYLAMQNNMADSVRAFAELMTELQDLIPEDKRTELIAGKSANGTPAFYIATENGNIEAATEWYNMLLLISKPTDYVALITAKNDEGFPAVCMSYAIGSDDTLSVTGKLISMINDDQILAQLILAEDPEGEVGIGYALIENRVTSICACKEWLFYIQNPWKRSEVAAKLVVKVGDHVRHVMKQGDTKTIAAFGELVQLIQNKEQRRQCVDALKLGKMKNQFLQLTNTPK